MNDQATSMAQRSTDLALERTRLAKDRTFAAVVRTALSFFGFGIAVAKLHEEGVKEPRWYVTSTKLLLLVTAILALLVVGLL